MEKIFYDNASTTKVDPEVLKLYNAFQTDRYYNPSAPYPDATDAKNAVETARRELLSALKGDGNIVFVSSGTEADNQALFCTRKQKTSRILIASAEHPAVYQSAAELRQRGYAVDFADVDRSGRVIFESFRSKMTENTDFVSVMHVSNETGAVNDLAALARYAKSIDPQTLFHSDGVQAVGKIPVNLRALGVDLYSFSGHKIHAPKGVGALFVRKGVNLRPLLFGGGQENGLRSSTENVGGIAALAEAVKRAVALLPETSEKLGAIRAKLKKILLEVDPKLYFLSSDQNSTPNILTFASDSVRGEVLLHALEGYGIAIGTGSACSSKRATRRVPEELGVPIDFLNGIVRLSFSKFNDISECDYFEKCIKQEYTKLKKYARS